MSTTYPDLTYTTFPDQEQSFVEMEDITDGDAVALTNYQNAMKQGDFQAAQQALSSMTNANNKLIKVRIAGDTCDGDDVYFYQNSEKYCIMPEIKKGETLYIGVFGCGAYQEILSGIGGIHHCLNPEENDLIIYKKNGKNVFYKIRGSQNEKAIFKRLNYLKVKEMKRFKIKK